MGDKGQVKLIYGHNESIYLYSHWGGCDLLQDVQDALKRKWRWEDSEYLGRIIFDAIISGTHDTETGFGIGFRVRSDIEHPLVVVDLDNNT